MNAYEEKRQAKIERLKAAAERARQESNAAHAQAHNMADVIPFGQPILVGHHSEKRDRNYRAKINNKFQQSFDLQEKANRLEERARAMELNRAIFTDDQNAAEKISDKIARLEARQERMKAANKLVKKGDREGLLDMGYTETEVTRLFTPNCFGGIGYETFQLTNNGANIRRLKERLIKVERLAQAEYKETEHEDIGVKVVENPEENRLQIYFPGKPDESIRSMLKSHGFRWAPSNGAWQGYLTNNSRYWAAEIIKKLES